MRCWFHEVKLVQDDGARGGVVEGEGKRSVLARICSGYVITPQKRRYWKKRSEDPDGMVQRQINQFSVRV